MTSKHNQSSRRHPLKRVRPNNENQGSIISSNGRANKKFCRQLSEDSAFIEMEKSSDERAFDLFYKEYFCEFRPFFKNRSIVVQFVEHLWSNMIESSKVSFIKKILKHQGICDISSRNFNDPDTYSNDENDSQISNLLNDSDRNISTLNSINKYSRGFVTDLLIYMKHCLTPRFIDKKNNFSSKSIIPLRRSSRIRRAPVKCVCSTCVTTGATDQHLSSSSSTNESDHKIFQQLIDHYHRLDDQYGDLSTSSLLANDEDDDDSQIKFNETNESQIQMALSEVVDQVIHVTSSPPIIPMVSVESNDVPISTLDYFLEPSTIFNEKVPLVLSDSLSTDENPIRRTYIILTELDEPFFGPYPIEFTITI